MRQSKEQLQKKYDDCVELYRQWYIEYHTTNGKTDIVTIVYDGTTYFASAIQNF